MELSKLLKIFSFFLIISTSHALDYERKVELPNIATKQAVNNIRFISKDGKFTYYQRRTGSFLLSTNYKVSEVLKGNVGTNYVVTSSAARKKLLISKDPYFHTFYGVRKLNDIYEIDFGETKAKLIGKGINAKLHLDDSWVSYYNPAKKIIYLHSLKSKALNYSIKLNNKMNPYFFPQVEMPNEDEVIYTDLNNKGVTGLIKFNKKTKKYSTQIKAQSVNEKFITCLNDKKLYLMEYGFDQSKRGTLISSTNRTKIDFGKRDIIYESNHNDLGPIVCNLDDKNIYFVKNLGPKNVPANAQEVVRVNIDNQKQTILSNIQYATQAILMDTKLLLPFRGKFLVLLDEKSNSNLEILEKEKLEKKE